MRLLVILAVLARVLGDADKSEELEQVPQDVVLETNANHTESNDTDEVPADLDWMVTAVKDVAYYLRAHKFNEYDRRYYRKEEAAPKELFTRFPTPPLRTLHWEVRENCEAGFMDCLAYLHEKVVLAELRRIDDTVTIMNEKHWTLTNNSDQMNTSLASCERLSRLDKISGIPFQGPLERFQWRTTASYYMCWYTMKDLPLLILFGERCDNFANCVDPVLGANNKDPRGDDHQSYRCALYSFCPDPCCPNKHYTSLEECWDAPTNPCYKEAAADKRQCLFKRNENKDFVALVLNQWNVSCNCTQPGYRWVSKYGMCVDIDECREESHSCNKTNEACFNLPGAYTCGCQWGSVYDTKKQECIQSPVIMSAVNFKELNLGVEIKASLFNMALTTLSLLPWV